MRSAEFEMRNINLSLVSGLLWAITALWSAPALAQIKVIETDRENLDTDNSGFMMKKHDKALPYPPLS